MADIDKITRELGKRFPTEYAYCSKCSLWQRGLQASLVTDEQFKQARHYYGSLWNYTGD